MSENENNNDKNQAVTVAGNNRIKIEMQYAILTSVNFKVQTLFKERDHLDFSTKLTNLLVSKSFDISHLIRSVGPLDDSRGFCIATAPTVQSISYWTQ